MIVEKKQGDASQHPAEGPCSADIKIISVAVLTCLVQPPLSHFLLRHAEVGSTVVQT